MPFIDTGRFLESDWEYVFLMQHYGVPTRLLDWSESLFVGLWFALEKPDDDDAQLWILRPDLLNKQAFAFQNYDGGPFVPGELQLKSYMPNASEPLNNLPVALYGTHNSPRIVAQRGTFTIAGRDMAGMEAQGLEAGVLGQLLIPKNEKSKLRADIQAVGFSESMVFPDLEGLARELKAQEGF